MSHQHCSCFLFYRLADFRQLKVSAEIWYFQNLRVNLDFFAFDGPIVTSWFEFTLLRNWTCLKFDFGRSYLHLESFWNFDSFFSGTGASRFSSFHSWQRSSLACSHFAWRLPRYSRFGHLLRHTHLNCWLKIADLMENRLTFCVSVFAVTLLVLKHLLASVTEILKIFRIQS